MNEVYSKMENEELDKEKKENMLKDGSMMESSYSNSLRHFS